MLPHRSLRDRQKTRPFRIRYRRYFLPGVSCRVRHCEVVPTAVTFELKLERNGASRPVFARDLSCITGQLALFRYK